jgi:hypothetical protein
VCNCAIIKTPLPHLERSSNKAERSRAKGREKISKVQEARHASISLSIMDKSVEKWSFGRRYVNQIIQASEVISNLGAMAPILPQTER